MAGWVFADLLLVLFIVGLGSAVAYTPPPPPEPEPKIPPIVGMKTEPTSVLVDVNGPLLARGLSLTPPQRRAVCASVKRGLGPVRGERAALVLIFGGAPEVTSGQNVARAIGRELGCADKKVFRGKVPTRAFWDGTLPLGKARLEIFLFLRQGENR
ncbi:hypothetical protein ACFP3Q_14375 [Nocardioides sp. GCM10027113]|uniref:hypothetical protein n=1 Tax=unclassified Nocardioides TaxID=2615069 RepID=UPI00361FB193